MFKRSKVECKPAKVYWLFSKGHVHAVTVYTWRNRWGWQFSLKQVRFNSGNPYTCRHIGPIWVRSYQRKIK